MTQKEILKLVDKFIKDKDLKSDEEKLNRYYEDLYGRLNETEKFWNKANSEDDKDDVQTLIFSIARYDDGFMIHFSETSGKVRILLSEKPKILLRTKLGDKETLFSRFRLVCAYFFRLIIDQEILISEKGFVGLFIDSRDFLINLAIREGAEESRYYAKSIDYENYDAIKRKNSGKYLDANGVYTHENHLTLSYKTAKYILKSQGAFQDKKYLDEYYERLDEVLSMVEQNFILMYVSDDDIYEPALQTYSHDVVDDIVRLVFKENPRILLDTPLYEGETKEERTTTLLAYLFYLNLHRDDLPFAEDMLDGLDDEIAELIEPDKEKMN